MKLSKQQWAKIEPLLPKKIRRADGKGRPAYPVKDVFEGILWVLKTGARWQDIPERSGYPSYVTCFRTFKEWRSKKIFEKIIKILVQDLMDRGKINLAETFIDATFVDAKKGALKSAKLRVEKAQKSWQWSTINLFQSPYSLKVLHRMRVSLLKQQFGPGIAKTFLKELSETKLTILILSGNAFEDDLESNLLLPISRIAKNALKMGDLLDATKNAGKWRDFLPGSNIFDE